MDWQDRPFISSMYVAFILDKYEIKINIEIKNYYQIKTPLGITETGSGRGMSLGGGVWVGEGGGVKPVENIRACFSLGLSETCFDKAPSGIGKLGRCKLSTRTGSWVGIMDSVDIRWRHYSQLTTQIVFLLQYWVGTVDTSTKIDKYPFSKLIHLKHTILIDIK